MSIKALNKRTLSWAMYDWANSAFATTVMTVFFPIFFTSYWAKGQSNADTTYYIGLANSLASLFIVILAPILGSIADQGGNRRKFLLSFAFLGILNCFGLFLVGQGMWGVAVIIYILACIGFAGANTFYDSLIVGIAERRYFDFVSALGYSLGYLGGGILLALNIFMVMKPGFFGIPDAATAIRYSFITVAVWWAVFSIPILLFVKEPKVENPNKGMNAIKEGFRVLKTTFSHIKQLKMILIFLIAFWLYMDAVHTVFKMAVPFGLSVGLDKNDLIGAILLTQFIGFPSAIGFGYLGEKIGAKIGIYIAIVIYALVCLFAYYSLETATDFYIMAGLIGLVQGGIQSLSRSLYARMIPPTKTAEFFGFYNMMGKFAAVLGPVMMGYVGKVTGNPRASMLPIIVMLIIGGLILTKVDEKKALEDSALAFEGD